jgi:hypothetical protein
VNPATVVRKWSCAGETPRAQQHLEDGVALGVEGGHSGQERVRDGRVAGASRVALAGDNR